ncbi:hypothetical protein IMZ11_36960 [Microtetraspora sp. AC03309]|uniref:DUF732 domain-containing protein n=1 Tax=Microtetraspora sp. AC03309 TaxID=2779376 RepID=UPI001E2A9C8F|nr:DUF732 domain-containing protein [Microtetraspora sp. AC03309]MCC5581213.1 hypothetical protein [Microtetraspora sp. AC03309]
MHQTPGYPQQPYDAPPQQQWQQQPGQPGPPPPPTSRRKPRSKAPLLIVVAIVVVAVVGVAIVLLTGGEEAKPPAANPTKSAAADRAAKLPTPDAGQRAVYLETLQAIAPGLAENEDRAIRQAGQVCSRILNPPEGGMSLAQYTVAQLSGGDTAITQAQAYKVIGAVKVWCAKS